MGCRNAAFFPEALETGMETACRLSIHAVSCEVDLFSGPHRLEAMPDRSL